MTPQKTLRLRMHASPRRFLLAALVVLSVFAGVVPSTASASFVNPEPDPGARKWIIVESNPVRYTDPTGLKLQIVIDQGGERELAQTLRALFSIGTGRVSGGRSNLARTENGRLQLTLSRANWSRPSEADLEYRSSKPCQCRGGSGPKIPPEARLREFRNDAQRLAKVIESEKTYYLFATTNAKFKLLEDSDSILRDGGGTRSSDFTGVLLGNPRVQRRHPLDAAIYHELILHALMDLPDPDQDQYVGQLIRDEENSFRRARCEDER